MNEKALQVIERVNQKLTGRDFKPDVELTVEDQVSQLIQQAQSMEAFCQSFVGWCVYLACLHCGADPAQVRFLVIDTTDLS